MIIQPITRSLRALKRQIADAEWLGRDATPLRTRLASLELMAQFGELWDVPF